MTRGRRGVATMLAALLMAGCSLATVGDVPAAGEPPNWFTTTLPALNGDGSVMMFMRQAPISVTDQSPRTDVLVRNLVTKRTTRINIDSTGVTIPGFNSSRGVDAAGNRVLFGTDRAAVPADTNGRDDLYVRDVGAGTTTLVAVDSRGNPLTTGLGGVSGGTISDDGNRVAFAFLDLLHPAHAYVRDLQAGTTTDLGVTDAQFVQMSGDGAHFVVYPKGPLDYDKAPVIIDPQGSTLAKRAFCDGVQARPLSADGRIMVVSIFSAATCPGISGQQIWDRLADTLTPIVPTVPTGNPNAFNVYGSDASGRFIGLTDATVSPAQVRVLDRATGSTRTVSVGPHGEPANTGSSGGLISGDGRRIAFWSTATNLVDPAATTGHAYVKDVVQPALTSLTPNSTARATQRSVTLKGSGFNQPLVVLVIDGVLPTAVTVVDEHTITATISVAGNARVGPRDVWLLQGSSSALCGGCLTVT